MTAVSFYFIYLFILDRFQQSAPHFVSKALSALLLTPASDSKFFVYNDCNLLGHVTSHLFM